MVCLVCLIAGQHQQDPFVLSSQRYLAHFAIQYERRVPEWYWSNPLSYTSSLIISKQLLRKNETLSRINYNQQIKRNWNTHIYVNVRKSVKRESYIWGVIGSSQQLYFPSTTLPHPIFPGYAMFSMEDDIHCYLIRYSKPTSILNDTDNDGTYATWQSL